jgi:hypothetical protein
MTTLSRPHSLPPVRCESLRMGHISMRPAYRVTAMFAAVRRIGYPALAIAAALLASDAAWAVCTPAAGNNVTATCTGTTFDQNIVPVLKWGYLR